MKELAKQHSHKLVISVAVIVTSLVLGFLTIWHNPQITLQESPARTAVIKIADDMHATPSTMVITEGTQVVWQNTTGKSIKLGISYGGGYESTVAPHSSYTLVISQPGTLNYSFGSSSTAKGSLIVKS